MAIRIDDDALEDAIERLGARQPVPVTKATLARGILRQAVEACAASSNPLAWLPSRQSSNGEPARDADQHRRQSGGDTDDGPAMKPVDSNDSKDAASVNPPAATPGNTTSPAQSGSDH